MLTRDVLWKGIIEDLFDDFLYFFFPDDVDQIDFHRGFEFLDKELIELFPESENNRRYADKLVKVWLRTGEERWFLVHVEVQGYRDAEFAQRMFTYFYRILDRHQQPITAVAILTDSSKTWKPQAYKYSFLGTSLTYKFNTYKLAEVPKIDLEHDPNIFALVMETALEALQKKVDDEKLLEIKVSLVRKLLERGIPQQKIRHLLGFIKFYVQFAKPETTRNFEEKIQQFTQKQKAMGIIESIQEAYKKQGIEIGIEKGIEKGAFLTQIAHIRRMLMHGFDKSAIQDILDVPFALVEQVEQEMKEAGILK